MADIIDDLSIQANEGVKNLINNLKEAKKQVNELNAAAGKIKMPSEAKAQSQGADNANTSINNAREKSIKLIERERLAELKLQQDREKAFAKYEASQAKKQTLADKAALAAERAAQKETNATQKAISQEIAERRKREAAILRESNLRERLQYLRNKEETIPLSVNEKISNKISDAKKAEAIETAKLRVQLSQLNAENKKAAIGALNLMGSYQKLSAELNEVRSEAKNLAADMFTLEQAGEQNTAAYSQLAATYSTVAARTNVLDQGLRSIDARVGQYQRNVGNYSSAWNGLGNSINQLTREAPAFAVSLNTGFLAISNNLPTLVDEIGRLNTENDRLRAQGEPTKSVLRQIGAALFSWQTLLSVGITLLTIYGGKLIEWATSAKKASGEIDQLREATERYQNTIVEVTTASERELTALNRKIAVARDAAKSDQERAAAAKELIDQYPGYLQGLSQEDIMLAKNGVQTEKYSKAMRLLTGDIQKRVEAEAKQDKARETLKVIAQLEQEAEIRKRTNDEALRSQELYGVTSGQAKNDLKAIQERIKARKEQLKDDKEYIAIYGKIGINDSGSVNQLGLYTDSQIVDLQRRAQFLRDILRKEQEEINSIFKDTSLLDYKPEKQTELQYEALADFAASEYELLKTRLENQAAYNKEILEDEENGFADREHAATRYGEIRLQLSELQRNEQLRILEKEKNDAIKAIQDKAKEGTITQSNANAIINSLDKQFNFDRLKTYEDYAEGVKEVNKEVADSLKNVYKGISEQERANKASQISLDNLRQQALLLGNVDGSTTLQRYAEIENTFKRMAEAAEDRGNEELRTQRATIETEIERIRSLEKSEVNNEAINKLLAQQLSIDTKLTESAVKRAEEVAKLYEANKKATQEYLNSFTDDAFSNLGIEKLGTLFDQVEYQVVNSMGEIETKVGSTFDKLYDQAGTASEKFAVAFNTITEIGQQAFTALQANSEAYFRNQEAYAQRDRDIALKFAGESAEAKEEIEKQYQERLREIRRKEAQQQKETAIFNAIINTAQGVTSALAKANIPLSIIIGALGAAQIALIASREIPAYEFGTESHRGGLMRVNDAKGSNYREMVKLPDGRTIMPEGRNAVLNAPKGTKVLTARQTNTELNRMLTGSGIDYAGDILRSRPTERMAMDRGITDEQINRLGNMVANSMPVSNSLHLDKNGFTEYIRTGNTSHTHHNARVSFTPRNVRGKG